MVLKRVIPTLLLRNASLVKTVNFNKFNYIGDPVNTVRIFNELEVDELCFLDITATKENRDPNYKVLAEIAEECFMPLCYGGGLKDLEQVKKILGLGFEKVIINTAATMDSQLIPKIVNSFGSQSVIGSIDVKKPLFSSKKVFSHSGEYNTGVDPLMWAANLENMGVGEILLTSINHEGRWKGYDYELTKRVTENVNIPVIANGGCGNVEHIDIVLNKCGAQAAAVGSFVVYQKQNMGVLINFPNKALLKKIIEKK